MRILFLCIGNAGRSQIAQAFLERNDEHEVRSAGSHAESVLHPQVVEVMCELGIDLTGRRPRQLEPEADASWADVVVTMGCGDVCPRLPGREHHDWPLADPIGQPLERVREIRDEIACRVDELAARLDGRQSCSA
ncbi:MAG: arsenate reductase ArsC [Gaiellaceae bacterium MAG52_C11]|nr:arsenate reductase ArsC [Candidatus Gaiellasilicea maunaloa]